MLHTNFQVKIEGKSYNLHVLKTAESKTKKIKKDNTGIHHIMLMDGSGSMYNEAKSVVDTVKNTVSMLDKDLDTVSIIQFRGVNDYTVHLKNAVNSTQTLDYIENLLNVSGTTCFSSPLEEVVSIVNESATDKPILISLFTDGCPVVSWSDSEEMIKMIKSLNIIKDNHKLLGVNTYGFGDYYDESIVKEIAMLYASNFSHLDSIGQFQEFYNTNYEFVRNNNLSIDFKDAISIIKVSNKNVTFSKSESNQYKDGDIFYVLSTSKNILSKTDLKFKPFDLTEAEKKNALYALAAYMQFDNKADVALHIMQHSIKDSYLVDVISSAFTKQERFNTNNVLKSAIIDTSVRMQKGFSSVVHAKDAMSVYKALTILSQSDVEWLPFHKDSDKYERISKLSSTKSNFVTTNKESQSFRLDSFVWNESKVNLSIRCKIKGTIAIDEADALQFGVDKIPTFLWRNYTIIKDGFLNIKKLVLKATDDASHKTIQEVFTHNIKKIDETLYVVDLTKYPIISLIDLDKEILNTENLYKDVSELVSQKFKAKVLNSWIPKSNFNPSPYAEIFEKYNIAKDGSYSPEIMTNPNSEESDFYMSREFKFDLKGLTTIPKAEFKAPTKSIPQLKMNETIISLESIFDNLAALESEFKYCKVKQKELTNKIALVKLYLCLTKKSLDNIHLVDNNEVFIPTDKDLPPMIIKTERIKVYI